MIKASVIAMIVGLSILGIIVIVFQLWQCYLMRPRRNRRLNLQVTSGLHLDDLTFNPPAITPHNCSNVNVSMQAISSGPTPSFPSVLDITQERIHSHQSVHGITKDGSEEITTSEKSSVQEDLDLEDSDIGAEV